MKSYWFAALACCICAASAFGQAGMQPGIANEIRFRYNTVKTSITNAANEMPEDNYGFKPNPAEMSFGEWVAHVADTQVRQCSILTGQIKSVNAAQKKTKAEIVAALKESFDVCDEQFNALTDANALDMLGKTDRAPAYSRAGSLAYVTAHDNECYGSMAVYMRVKDIVPPSTAARGGGAGGRGMSGAGRGR